ncbi:histone H2A-Bbd type 1-like [Sus scrofa]|uniref:Histone H2A n=1 Tax=Sus scrofa TaxID=9823 RepID=A0A8W4FCJ2_PIG|nr:histone H2A-Bbd type 1-like [Sus scrofa]XP_020936274.1 histone H2A-Bbd type 1-like [Sus scrofa]
MSRKRNLPQCNPPKKQALSRSSRAELQFPVSRVDRYLREGRYAQRLSSHTPVFLAGVLEYLTANILELAAGEAHSSRKMRIAPEHVQRARSHNETLSSLFQASSVSRGAEEEAEEPLPEAGR